jgi:hypothetical protein
MDPLPRAISRASARRRVLETLGRAGFAECSLAEPEDAGELPRSLLELIPRNAALPQRLSRATDGESLVALVVHDGRSLPLEAELPALVQDALAGLGATGLALTLRSLEPAHALLAAHGVDAATRTRLLEDPASLAAPLAVEVPAGTAEAQDPAEMERVLLGLLGRLRFKTYGTRSPEEVAARLAGRLSRTLPAVARKIQAARAGLVELAAQDGKPAAALERASAVLSRAGCPDALAALRERVLDLGRLGVAPVRLELALREGATAALDPSWTLEALGHGVLARGGSFPFRGGRGAVALIRIASLALDAPPAPGVPVLVVPVSEAELATAHAFAVLARASGLHAELDPSGRNLRSSLRAASRRGVALVAILGEREAREGTVLVKDLATEEQRTFPRASAVAELAAWLRAPRAPAAAGEKT